MAHRKYHKLFYGIQLSVFPLRTMGLGLVTYMYVFVTLNEHMESPTNEPVLL